MTKITLGESLRHAVDGIGRCLVHERNFRIHGTAAVTVILFAWLYGVDTSQKAMLAVAISVVMTMEMMNTAIEAVVDLITQEMNVYAKIAKDVAAGMVLLAALFAIVIGVIVFHDWTKIAGVVKLLFSSWWAGILTVAYIAAAAWFIFGWKPRCRS